MAVCPAWATIAGGGSETTDCYAEWGDVTASKPAQPTTVDCKDGDPTCDEDGTVNATCRFSVNACIVQRDPALTSCSPMPLTKLTVSKSLLKTSSSVPVALQPPVALGVTGCGTAAEVVLPDHGPKAHKTFTMLAKTDQKGKLKTDKDKLVLRCSRGSTSCPTNAAGGPNEFQFDIKEHGGDLDNGWTGQSHNNPIVFGTKFRMCLKDCNASSSPACTEDVDYTNRVNSGTFGAPLPLVAASVPVCVVNQYGIPKASDGTVNFQTGDMSMTLHLLSKVVSTSVPNLCPICSGQNMGDSGKCDSTSTRAGSDCVVDGIVTVGALNPPKRFTLSTSCPPKGVVLGTITIPLALTSGTASMNGPKPCGESRDDGCGTSGPCGGPCTGTTTCASRDADNNCIDSRGGVSQYCCAGDGNVACFPTSSSAIGASAGKIERVGSTAPPVPAVPDPTFPKCGSSVLAAVFCESTTSSAVVNSVTGLPAPGAALLPVKYQITQTGSASCP